ncbi:MAG TPA: hypothetical protein VE547_12880 [Mycobacteriales bacterium]|nr:hypothetical protein [Mycobacteriales bacterium]
MLTGSGGDDARAGQERVYADLRDGRSVRLVVLDPFPWPGRDRAAEPVLDRLEAWRTGGTTVGR